MVDRVRADAFSTYAATGHGRNERRVRRLPVEVHEKLMAKKKPKKKTVAMSMAIQDKAAIAEGCYFDEQAADFVCEFFETYLRHTMGTHAGKPFKLLDWQRDDVLRPLFGWKCEDGSNRFNRGFIWTGKKQGKSTLSAGIALFYLMTSGKRA